MTPSFYLNSFILDIDAESLRVIISVAYCGIMELNRTNVRGVLIAAEYLGIDFLVKKCTEFYATQLKIDNDLVMEIRNLRNTHGHITSLNLAVEKSNIYVKVNTSRCNIKKIYINLNSFNILSNSLIFRKILRTS